MFSTEITSSDAFIDMPKESQLLYFHLGMNADDDGFISNTKMIQRVIGAGDDAVKTLFDKKFLILFDNGICVIKHWRISNQIRKDRYKETRYVEQKKQLFIRPNGSYTTNPQNAIPVPQGYFSMDEVEDYSPENALATSWQPVVALGKVREGKVSIDKISEDLPDWLDKKTWEDWVQYRKEKKQKLTPISVKKQIKMLEENKSDHVGIINQSIQNGWTGLFPLRKSAQNVLKPANDKYKGL